MANLIIRNIDDALKEQLRMQAAKHGRSMEEELRCILRQTLLQDKPVHHAFGSHLHARFAKFNSVELDLPARRDTAQGVDFSA